MPNIVPVLALNLSLTLFRHPKTTKKIIKSGEILNIHLLDHIIITDKGYYTNSYYIDSRENIEIKDKLTFESEFQKLSTGGAISKINVSGKTIDELEDIIRIVDNSVPYVGFISNGKMVENEDGQIQMSTFIK